ncbi:MAG: protein-tyrosine phosphatase family protein [Longimicrobiales bacterium]
MIPNTRLIAGDYPFHRIVQHGRTKLASCIAAGVTAFVDLTSPEDRLIPYQDQLFRDCTSARRYSFPIRDLGVPTVELMGRILDTIDSELSSGATVYLHCWGGVGRTGTVAGCYLRRQGWDPDEALAEVGRLFATMPEAKTIQHAGSPETHEQREFVRAWASPAR